MANQEQNNFKAALAEFRDLIGRKRDGLQGEAGVAQRVRGPLIEQGGWECDAADEWITDFVGMCTAATNEIDAVWRAVNEDHAAEPAEVDEGNWRGNRYNTAVPISPTSPAFCYRGVQPI